ncbi:MAG TPA: sigma-70 factor domain-containing protein, partial [Anaerolineales bacterium]|nr:sigma-70 factor domain-containing protein [Anaerolineales bacterium]
MIERDDLLSPEGQPEPELEEDVTEEVDETLEGAEAVEAVEAGDAGAEVEPDLDEMLEVEAEVEEESAAEEGQPTGDASDDTVRLYLKDIGREDLLSTDQELWLSVLREAPDRLEMTRPTR